MSLARIGPVDITFHGDPKFSWSAQPTGQRLRQATIAGSFEWNAAKALAELVDNEGRRQTVRGAVGVVEPIWFADHLLADMRGLYLLTGHSLPPDQPSSLNDIVPMTLQAAMIGSPVPRVTRSARPLANSVGSASTSLIAHPFPGADESFVIPPGGTKRTVAFDPLPHDPARIAAPAASMEVYVGNLTTTTDDLADVAVISLEGI